jgi:acetyl/propionyl-CoA carboxylase alpha subunit
MLTLRGSHNGETYEIEISRASASGSEYQCRVTKGNGFEKQLSVEVVSRVGSRWTFRIDGKIQDLVISRHDGQLLIDWNSRNYRLSIANPKDIHTVTSSDHRIDQNVIRAEMTGKVVTVSKRGGDPVAAGESLAAVEAMKMFNQVKSPKAGKVRKCHVEPGAVVNPGDLLFEIE